MFGDPAPTPAPPPLPDPLPSSPTYASGAGAKPAGAKPRPMGGTLLTSPGDDGGALTTQTARKSLLGQ